MKKTLLLALGLLLLGGAALAQQPTAEDRVAALKASLASSATTLRQYEWIETTTVSLKGEPKAQTQERCYYGADGKLQKVPVAAPPPAEKKRGLRGKIAENKKEELSDYMKEAVALIKSTSRRTPRRSTRSRPPAGSPSRPSPATGCASRSRPTSSRPTASTSK